MAFAILAAQTGARHTVAGWAAVRFLAPGSIWPLTNTGARSRTGSRCTSSCRKWLSFSQFLSSTTNIRFDRYGGSVENRARFLREILEQIGDVMPINRVGVRISPFALYNNVRDADPFATYGCVSQMLQEFGVAYVHAADANGGIGKPDLPRIVSIVRESFDGVHSFSVQC